MEKDHRPVYESICFLFSVLLLVGGLILLFAIDFLWGLFTIAVAFFCYWRAYTGRVKSVVPGQNLFEDD